ncbi:MAG: UDP-glucose 4-epimerase GalE [Chlamydiales bacterium 38-26]|nr:UDP-glucose 4-epimerase GalE [Chlamydiales bacterium]OJV07757.1 MAG: UDP-glucose 4-epimerase GalE [Chlamydiales bacterium 38-26]
MKAKVLVVGGAGYIGSEVNLQLHEKGYETVVLDNLISGNRRRVKEGLFIKGDIANRGLLEKIFHDHHFDAVMHFAAYINVGESVENPAKYYMNNVSNTLQLMDVMRKNAVSNFIFSSTAAVYGIPCQPLIKEDHPLQPVNPYGQSKLMIEKILEDYDRAYGFKSAKLRYFNAAGGDPWGRIKNYHQKKSNLIPIILSALKEHQPVTINGLDYDTPDGTCIRDYIHIYDLGTAHIKAMEKLREDQQSEAYNLGNGKGFSVLEVIKAAEKVTKKKITTVEGPRRPGDPPYLLADAQKAYALLNWKIKYPHLEEMISHAWKSL